MNEAGLLLAVLALFGYALIARRLANTVLTGPMLFLGLGWALAEMNLLHAEEAREFLLILAEITLTVVLFSDAAVTDLDRLRRRPVWPERMLLLGLPLAMVLGTLLGLLLLPEWPFWEVALIAAILTPTDAALGNAVYSNPAVPGRVRRALTTESGLNDGLSLPLILMIGCIAVGGAGAHEAIQGNWLVFAAKQIGFGLLAGAVLGWLGARGMLFAAGRGWSNDAFEGIGVLALAGSAYLTAYYSGGNGFVAAFVGGLAFGHVMKGRCAFVFEFMESEGQGLVLGTFLLAGAALLPGAAASIEPATLALILLSLLAVRPLAIGMALLRTRTPAIDKLFMGWFGPRGLATIVFSLFIVEELGGLRRSEDIVNIAAVAVLASAVLHGVTAAPAARWLGRRMEDSLEPGEEPVERTDGARDPDTARGSQ